MKTITYDEFITFEPCWLETPQGRRRLKYYAKKRERWSALDILALKHISAEDRLWAVLREELIDAIILHEFACRCAERALSKIDNPDPRSVNAVKTKRMWMAGNATGDELAAARAAARDAARDAAWDAAQVAAWDAAQVAAWAAAWVAARDVEREWQVNELIKMLEENVA